MPDWITHIAVAWILCTVIGFKYKQFNPSNTAIVMVGAILPDFVQIGSLGIWSFVEPLHIPIGTLIIAAMISLAFQEKKMVFLFLILGFTTHYALDLLETSINGGIYLFYPLYWGQYQFGLIPTDDYIITIISLILVFIVYLISRYHIKTKHEV
jgi:hypothetical protein